jgi:hypothetical protein
LHTPLQQAPFAAHWLPSDAHPPSPPPPNGLPLSPMVTPPLLLPVVESPPPSPAMPVRTLVLPPHALKLAAETNAESIATHINSGFRATNMVAPS